jgi:hypothetical protein
MVFQKALIEKTRNEKKRAYTFAEALEQGDYNRRLDKTFSLHFQLIHIHDVKETIRRELFIHQLLIIVMRMNITGILHFTLIEMATHE